MSEGHSEFGREIMKIRVIDIHKAPKSSTMNSRVQKKLIIKINSACQPEGFS